MVREAGTVEKLNVSVTLAAVIIVTLLSALWAFLHDMPNKKDVESNEAMSLRISTWTKEELGKVDSRAVASESRLQGQITEQNKQVLHRLDVLDEDIKTILSRLPRKFVMVR